MSVADPLAPKTMLPRQFVLQARGGNEPPCTGRQPKAIRAWPLCCVSIAGTSSDSLHPIRLRLREDVQKVAQFLLDLAGIIHSLRDLGCDEGPESLTQAMNRHLDGTFSHAQAPGGVEL